MASTLLFSEHLTRAPEHDAVGATLLGQAHIAGTGPEGATCRECVHWRKVRFDTERDRDVELPPAYFGARHPETPLVIKDRFCLYPIINKAERLIPHDARACRLFARSDSPPPIIRPERAKP